MDFYTLSPRQRLIYSAEALPISPSNLSRASSSAWSVASEALKDADGRVETLAKMAQELRKRTEREANAYQGRIAYLNKQLNFYKKQLQESVEERERMTLLRDQVISSQYSQVARLQEIVYQLQRQGIAPSSPAAASHLQSSPSRTIDIRAEEWDKREKEAHAMVEKLQQELREVETMKQALRLAMESLSRPQDKEREMQLDVEHIPPSLSPIREETQNTAGTPSPSTLSPRSLPSSALPNGSEDVIRTQALRISTLEQELKELQGAIGRVGEERDKLLFNIQRQYQASLQTVEGRVQQLEREKAENEKVLGRKLLEREDVGQAQKSLIQQMQARVEHYGQLLFDRDRALFQLQQVVQERERALYQLQAQHREKEEKERATSTHLAHVESQYQGKIQALETELRRQQEETERSLSAEREQKTRLQEELQKAIDIIAVAKRDYAEILEDLIQEETLNDELVQRNTQQEQVLLELRQNVESLSESLSEKSGEAEAAHGRLLAQESKQEECLADLRRELDGKEEEILQLQHRLREAERGNRSPSRAGERQSPSRSAAAGLSPREATAYFWGGGAEEPEIGTMSDATKALTALEAQCRKAASVLLSPASTSSQVEEWRRYSVHSLAVISALKAWLASPAPANTSPAMATLSETYSPPYPSTLRRSASDGYQPKGAATAGKGGDPVLALLSKIDNLISNSPPSRRLRNSQLEQRERRRARSTEILSRSTSPGKRDQRQTEA